MGIVTVTKHDQSQNKKDRVYFDNKHNWQDAFYVKQGLYLPPVGMTIDADTSSSEFRGQTYWYLNGFKEVKGAPVSAPPTSRGNGQSAPQSPPMQPGRGWNDVPTGDLSRFVSNVVGSAIAAGLIKDPKEVYRWVEAGYEAGQAMRTGQFHEEGPDPATHAGTPDRDFTDSEIPF